MSTPTVYFGQQFAAAGVPAQIAAAIQAFEGHQAPNQYIVDTNGQPSVGPLQINLGGQGSGYTLTELLGNGNLQAQIGVHPIATAYAAAQRKGLTGFAAFLYTLTGSGHPTSKGFASLTGMEQQQVLADAEQAWGAVTGAQVAYSPAQAAAAVAGGSTTSEGLWAHVKAYLAGLAQGATHPGQAVADTLGTGTNTVAGATGSAVKTAAKKAAGGIWSKVQTGLLVAGAGLVALLGIVFLVLPSGQKVVVQNGGGAQQEG